MIYDPIVVPGITSKADADEDSSDVYLVDRLAVRLAICPHDIVHVELLFDFGDGVVAGVALAGTQPAVLADLLQRAVERAGHWEEAGG